jgi:S1-C subfamily serine protease
MTSRSAGLIAAFLAPFLLAGSASAQELGAKQIAQGTFPSTVLLMMEDSSGEPSVLGSGFFVADNIIATNFHVIRGAARGYAKLVGQRSRFPIIGVDGVDEKRDLALLAVGVKAPALHLAGKRSAGTTSAFGGQAAADPPQLPPDLFDKAPALPPGPTLDPNEKDTIEIGDSVYAVGNPEGLEGTFSQGLVSGIRHIDADTILQITAPLSPGSSGGPVVNSSGHVVGIAVATFTEGQNLNFAVPVEYLVTLLKNAKEPVPFNQSVNSNPSRSHSILEGLGGDSRDGVTAGQFKWAFNGSNFTFSLRNQLGDPISDVSCAVIFYDRSKQPIEFQLVHLDDTIPPGLARRVRGSYLDDSVYLLVEKLLPGEHGEDPSYGRLGESGFKRAEDPQSGAVEFRILDFRVVR